jgi:hypothetical protein
MANERDFEGTQRKLTRGDSGSNNPDQTGDRARSPNTPDPGRLARGEAIRIVSDQLSARKAVFDKPPASGLSPLPKISNLLGDISDRLQSSSNPQANFDSVGSSLGSPTINLPEVIKADRTKRVEASSEEPSRIETSAESHSSSAVAPNRSSTSSGSVAPATSPPASKPTASFEAASVGSNEPGGERLTDHRITAPIPTVDAGQGPSRTTPASDHPGDLNHRIPATVAPVHAAQGPIDASTGGMNSLQVHPDPAIRVMTGSDASITNGVESSAGGPRDPIARTASSANQPRASNRVTGLPESRHSVDVERNGVGVSSAGMTAGHQTSSPVHAEPSTNFVRNPLSADLRNSSMASSSPTEEGTSLPGHGGSGRNSGEDLFGATSASQEGGSLDLSKTNELLQQLVDAVSKQSGSCLPIGGPSVYPDR